MGIPFELITLLGSTFLGGVMKLWGMKQQDKMAQNKALLERAGLRKKAVAEAREFQNEGYMFTRRTIALTATFSIILLPKLAALFTQTPVIVGWTHFDPGFLFFSEGKEVLDWYAMKGLVITPLDTHLMSSVIGLYFGGSIVGSRR